MKQISISLDDNSKEKIVEALKRYSPNEIGGILIGNKVSEDYIIVNDVSISNESGLFNFASFIRDTVKAQKLLNEHYKNSTGFYVGEWHSHPSFSLNPSGKDIITMKGIIQDKNYNASFAILIIVKLNLEKELESKGFLFHKEIKEYICLE
ncbi:MAG: Mov34/MPN/PAD-1 family protein [Bacteroidales bacterium]|nr:Mov34/MPN/PAD-1 family protein [Bacteroidales bacterium]